MRTIACALCWLVAASAAAADYRSIGQGGAVMYDAPSVKAKKLYVASSDYPVEVVVDDGAWVKLDEEACKKGR